MMGYKGLLWAVGTWLCIVGLLSCQPPAGPSATRPAPEPAGVSASAGSGASSGTVRESGTQAESQTSLQGLVEAARKEGQLTFLWSENWFGGAEGVRRWTEGFNRAYGLNISTRFTPGPSPNEVTARIAQEYQSGRPASSDMILVGSSPLAGILGLNMLEPVDWASWAPNIIPELVAPGGIAVEVAIRTPGITYNTTRFTAETAPQSLAQLLAPRYKGRVATTPYASGFDWLATSDFWGEQRTFDYLRRLAEQSVGQIRCGDMPRVASGEFEILALDCGAFEAVKWARKGAPLVSVIPTDVGAITYTYMAVPRNAAHPAAAKLWVNYLLSREAQEILWELDAQDHHRLPGSRLATEVEQAQARGAKLVQVDIQFFQRHGEDDLKRLNEEAVRILREQ